MTRAEVGRPSGTVTFLFTDIEASTALWESAPDAMRSALATHDATVRRQIADHRGVVFATGGDGFAVAFGTAGDALRAAVAIQRDLTATAWPTGAALRVRIGIHTGEAWERNGDYFGSPVNTAARLMSVAGPGQVLCSHITAALAAPHVTVSLVDLGECSLRGLSAPVRVYGAVGDGLTAPSITSRRPSGNLPGIPTEFVGRSAEVDDLVRLLHSRRCVTLTGTGGVGKTRLAIEVGWVDAVDRRDGVWLVDLATVMDPESVAVAVAQTMALRVNEHQSILNAVIEGLGPRQLLLVLDNCEHVLDACCELVERIVAECPGVSVLTTSREPLGIAGEQVWRVASLDPAREGAELFMDRAKLADSSFSPRAEDFGSISEICARLDGIPLAIELAAARVRSLGIAGVQSRLDDRFALLRGGRRRGLERHQTLRATVAWSYQLLSNVESLVFDRAAVFAGSFDLEAASAVCADSDVDRDDVIDVVTSLVDKSMLSVVPGDDGPRYRVLETLRQFAEERLIERAELPQCSRQHLRHYHEVARAAGDDYGTSSLPHAVRVFRSEWANLRAALNWALSSGDVATAAGIVEATAIYAVTSLRYEHDDWTRAVLDAATTSDDLAAVAPLRGIAAYWLVLRGDHEDALEGSQAALWSPQCTDATRLWCLLTQCMAHFARGDVGESAIAAAALSATAANATTYWQLTGAVMESQAAYASGGEWSPAYDAVMRFAAVVDNDAARSFVAGHRAVLAHLAGDVGGSLELFGHAVDHARHAGALTLEGGWMTGVAFALSGLTLADSTSAKALGDLLRHAAATQDGLSAWTGLEVLAIYLASGGHVEPAAVILGHLEHANRRTGDLAAGRARAEATVAVHADARTWSERGAQMSRDELIEYAVATLARVGGEIHTEG